MEVFSVFSSDKKLIEKLVNSFFSETGIKLASEDDDTIYFESNSTGALEFYLHIETDFEEEIKFEFNKEEERFIKSFFRNEEIFMLDISYKDSTFLYQLLSNFITYLKLNDEAEFIALLFHDPFQGFVEIEGIGKVVG